MSRNLAAKIQERTGAYADVLSNSTFRWLWIASMVSTVGTSMHEIGAAWLMTSLAHSPLYISLVQTASTMPIFLLSIPSGALADIVGRRRMLLLTQLWMLCAAALLGINTLLQLTDPLSLLALSFVMGIGNALNIPPWQALTADLMDKNNLQRGIVLQSIGSNLARALGPAVGGIAVAALGPGWVFVLNAISFAGVICVLWQWRPHIKKGHLPAERFLQAVRNSVSYSLHSPELTTVLIRTAAFMFFASASLALIPVIIRHHMHEGPQMLGIVLAFNGLGALAAAPYVRKFKSNLDLSCGMAAVAYAIALFGLALCRTVWGLCLCMLLAGAAWLVVNSTLNAATQVASPAWMRARAISVQQLVFFGALALGSLCWGAFAAYISTTLSLCMASIGMLCATLAASAAKLSPVFAVKLDYSDHWGDIHVDRQVPMGKGPVLIKMEYVVDEAFIPQFKDAVKHLRKARLRSGALRWELYQDVSDATRFVEIFLSESWADHLRQHEHASVEDKLAEDQVLAFHVGPEPVRMHFIYESLSHHNNH